MNYQLKCIIIIEPECDKVDSNHITAADCQGYRITVHLQLNF